MSAPPIIFVLGVPRSGTTLLRLMLAGHPRLFSPPEMVLAPFETMAQRKAALDFRFWEKGGLRRTFIELEGLDVDAAKRRVDELESKTVPDVYAILQQAIGERFLVDKCPHLAGEPEALKRLNRWFPDARYLFIQRHPAAVIRSLQNVNMAEALAATYGPPEEVWRQGNQMLQQFLDTLPAERWTRFRYEDLVSAPEPVLRQICRTIGVDFHQAMLEPYQGERMLTGPPGANATGDPNTARRERIEPELAEKWFAGFDHRSVTDATRVLARQLGYELESIPLPPLTKVSTAIGDLLTTVRKLETEMTIPLDLDNLEGRRFLMRLLSAAVDTCTEHSDPDRPTWHRFIGPTRKLFGDCPDCDYRRAPIRPGPGRVYRVSGTLTADVRYLGFVLHGKGGRLGTHLQSRQLKPDASGKFEILISSEEQPGTWLRCEGDETELVVRQYFDGPHAPIHLKLELLGPASPAAPALDAVTYAAGIARAERMVKSVIGRLGKSYQMASWMPSKQFVTVDEQAAFPTPDNLYQVCWYRFGPGQSLVVRGRLPKAPYFSLCLYNAWMESLDYTHHSVSLNQSQLRTEADGSFEVTIGPKKPGQGNWLDSCGHEAGYVFARSLLLEGPPAELTTETIRLP